MSQFITLGELEKILGISSLSLSEHQSQQMIQGFTTDSRILKPDEVFIALRGSNFDGHDFLEKARDHGALAAIIDQSCQQIPEHLPYFRVSDTLIAYQTIAHWWRMRFNIPVIAITGSVGKTTTKELISAVLQTRGNVLKTALNHNNEIGVPQTLLQITSDHQYAVIEMGMRGLGEIALLTQIATPTIAVITNVGTAHIGRLGSREAIAQAKCELLAELSPTGVAILNHDQPLLLATAKTVWGGKTVTYGLEGGDIQGKLINEKTLQVEGKEFPLPLVGEHHALNYLAALAVAKVIGISWETIKTSRFELELPSGRAKRYELRDDIVLLDESYNAGLESMIAGLKLLANTPGKRRIAVLGTMKELGDYSLEFHHQVGEIAYQLQLDGLFILADFAEAQALATGASGIPFIEVEDINQPDVHERLANHLKEFIQPGDCLLFKASNAVGLNQVVQQLLSFFPIS